MNRHRIRDLVAAAVIVGLTSVPSVSCVNANASPTADSAPPVAPITNLTYHYSCTSRTSPFFQLMCIGSMSFTLNATVRSGLVVATMRYASTGSEFEGSEAVSRPYGPGLVTITNFQMTTTSPCFSSYSSSVTVYDGTEDQNVIVGTLPVTFSGTC